MAIITGTTGSDTIVGTDQNDTINALTGYSDMVDGAGGYDTLIVDYSALSATVYSFVTLDDALSGTIGFPLANNFVSFSRIEALNVRLDSRANQFTFDALKPFNGKVVSIDGGLGDDTFIFNAPSFSSVSFKVDGAGVVTHNLGLTLSGFEDFQLYFGGGANTITTGAREDIVSVGVGTSTIATGGRNDTIIVHGGHDMVDGGDDRDTLSIELGDTSASHVLNHDRLKATASIAGMLSAKNVEIVNAVLGSGADTITMTDAWSGSINSGAGADVFRLARPDGVSIDGGAGVDFASINLSGTDRYLAQTVLRSNGAGGFDGGKGSGAVSIRSMEKLYITLGSADDRASVDAASLAKGAVLTMNGGVGDDRLSLDFSSRPAVKIGFVADGSLKYGAGVFTGFERFDFTGTAGSDQFTGGAADLTVKAGDGGDILRGGDGDDRLFGEAGNDKLYLSGGWDELHGGAGNDHYFIDVPYNFVSLYEEENEGVDTVFASVDAFLGPNIEILRLTGTADITGVGFDNDNMIVGNSGGNRLDGQGGRDVISGGDGIDFISGGAGADTLSGGNGIDAFYFDALGTSADRDTITDFVAGQDVLILSRNAFSAFADVPFGSGLSATNFLVGTKAMSADHHIIYNAATGALYYDADGFGGAAQIQLATLSTKPVLHADDFSLI